MRWLTWFGGWLHIRWFRLTFEQAQQTPWPTTKICISWLQMKNWRSTGDRLKIGRRLNTRKLAHFAANWTSFSSPFSSFNSSFLSCIVWIIDSVSVCRFGVGLVSGFLSVHESSHDKQNDKHTQTHSIFTHTHQITIVFSRRWYYLMAEKTDNLVNKRRRSNDSD